MQSIILFCAFELLNKEDRVAFFQTANEPVRLQSLKLLGTLAFNASSLIFSHLDVIVKRLIDMTKEQEPQVAFHACRVMEIISGRLVDSKSPDVSKFWSIAFSPIVTLVQHPQTSLREVACDCLGNIGAEMFAQLSVSVFNRMSGLFVTPAGCQSIRKIPGSYFIAV